MDRIYIYWLDVNLGWVHFPEHAEGVIARHREYRRSRGQRTSAREYRTETV